MDSAKILLVDYNTEDRLSVSALLEARGYNVCSADNAGEALKRINDDIFDLIIIDPLTNDAKGNDVFGRLKAFTRKKAAPLMVLASGDEVEEIEELFKKGIDDYIVKPPRASYLISRVEHYTAGNRADK